MSQLQKLNEKKSPMAQFMTACSESYIYPHFTYMYVHVVADFVVIFNMLKYAFQHYSTSILGLKGCHSTVVSSRYS